MTNDKVDINFELGKIESRFGKISMELDLCKLSNIAKGSVMIVDHGRALKENGLITPTDYLKIINRVNEYIEETDKKCVCKRK